jgi:XTP/dITP diphosphohydrolase
MNLNQEFVFATHSAHKLAEVQQLMGGRISFRSLADLGFHDEIPEPFFTLEENARTKTDTVFERVGISTFSEDTGLFITSLGGEPGVHTARYAGLPPDNARNMALVLKNLQNKEDRSAYFQTVICLRTPEGLNYFTGICQGSIAWEPSGEKGFGYDPVFIPEGYNTTFAELGEEVKHQISHRSRAFNELRKFLLGE